MNIIDEIARIIQPDIWDDWSGQPQDMIDKANEALKYKRGNARFIAVQVLMRLCKIANWKEQFIQNEVADWIKLGWPNTPDLEKIVREKYEP